MVGALHDACGFGISVFRRWLGFGIDEICF